MIWSDIGWILEFSQSLSFKASATDVRLACRLRVAEETGWNAVGHVSKITANEEVALELRGPQQVQPEHAATVAV